MEFQKITNLLDAASDDIDLPRFVTEKQIEIYDQSGEIRIKTSMLSSDLCDFSDAYIVVKETVTLEGDIDATNRNKNLVFKNVHHL